MLSICKHLADGSYDTKKPVQLLPWLDNVFRFPEAEQAKTIAQSAAGLNGFQGTNGFSLIEGEIAALSFGAELARVVDLTTTGNNMALIDTDSGKALSLVDVLQQVQNRLTVVISGTMHEWAGAGETLAQQSYRTCMSALVKYSRFLEQASGFVAANLQASARHRLTAKANTLNPAQRLLFELKLAIKKTNKAPNDDASFVGKFGENYYTPFRYEDPDLLTAPNFADLAAENQAHYSFPSAVTGERLHLYCTAVTPEGNTNFFSFPAYLLKEDKHTVLGKVTFGDIKNTTKVAKFVQLVDSKIGQAWMTVVDPQAMA